MTSKFNKRGISVDWNNNKMALQNILLTFFSILINADFVSFKLEAVKLSFYF